MNGSGPRRWIAGLLISIAAAMLTLSAMTLWMRSTIVDTDRTAALGESLARNEGFRVALSEVIVTRLLDNGPEVLTERREQIQESTEAALASDEFAEILGAAFGDLHSSVISGRKGQLDVSRTHALIESELLERGMAPDVVSQLPGPERLSRIVTLPDELTEAGENAVSYANQASVIVPLIALAALAGGLIISPRRWRSLATLGVLVMLSAGSTLVGLLVAGYAISHQTTDPAGREAASAAWNTIVGGLRTQLIILVVLGAIAGAAGFAVNRARSPV
ncbi:MAG: hypothetical protein WD276_01765 [Actinomycetota bacterium]